MNSTKFLKIIIVFLLLINLSTILFMWLHRPHREGEVRGFFEKELQFSPQQVDSFDVLKEEHRNNMEQLKAKSKQLHDAYFDLLKNPSVDTATVSKAALQLAMLKEQEEKVTFYHFQKVRALCNEAQKIKFDKIIKEAARHMGPSRGPREEDGPPPGPRGGEEHHHHE